MNGVETMRRQALSGTEIYPARPSNPDAPEISLRLVRGDREAGLRSGFMLISDAPANSTG